MNSKRYQIIFSTRLNALVVVGENCTRSGKSVGESRAGSAFVAQLASITRFVGVLALGLALVTTAFAEPLADALPVGGAVAQGAVTISQSANAMVINQDTSKAIVNWQSFDIGAAARVNVIQPSSESVLLNRVLGNNPSQIFGSLDANGQVILINPNGILFGKDGSVNANAFTASTLDMRDADFMAGNYRYFSTGVNGEIVNQGGINAQQYVALIGAKVINDGAINTNGGNVYLGAAEAITVPVSNSGRIKMELSPASINTAVENTQNGVIVTQGGQVYIQASSLNDAVASIASAGQIDTSAAQAGSVALLADHGTIKVDGSIKANSTLDTNKGGDIIIGRDAITGVLAKATDVSGAALESKRGFVETSGDYLASEGVKVSAGMWLLDPTNVVISTSATTAGTQSGQSGATLFNNASNVNAADIQSAISGGTGVWIWSNGGSITMPSYTTAAPLVLTNNTNTNVDFILDSSSVVGGAITVGGITGVSGAGRTGTVGFSAKSSAAQVLVNGAVNMNGAVTLQNTTNANTTNATASAGVSVAAAVTGSLVTINGISSGAVGVDVTGAITSTSGVAIKSTGGNINVAGIMNATGNVALQAAGAMIRNNAAISGSNVSIDNTGGTIDASTGAITAGSASAGAAVNGIELLAAVTASKNLNVYGASSGANGILSQANLSAAYINATGKSTSGSVAYAWNGGTISTTGTGGASTASTVTGISAASTSASNGWAAFTMYNNASATAAAGTTLSLIGNAPTVAAGAAANERGWRINSGVTLNTTGDISLIGTSASSDGLLIGGTINNQVSTSSKLTLQGTTSASSSNGLNGVNISGGVINGGTSTGIIKVIGTANNASTTTPDYAVSVAGAINGGSASNVMIQSTGGRITTSAAITGTNISIDNTNGTISTTAGATNGAITAGTSTGVASTGVGINIGGAVTASGNLNLYGLSVGGSGINLAANQTISGGNIQATGKTGGTAGIYLNAGSNVTTTGTSGASILTGYGTSTTAGGGQAVVALMGNTLTAASGTTLALTGNATGSAAALFSNTRGLRVDGVVNTYGTVTLTGNSSSNDGLLVQAGGINVQTGSLTLNGKMTANSNSSSQTGVTVSQPIKLYNGTSLSITGEASNLLTSGLVNSETGVSIGGAISQASGQTTAGNISITGFSKSFANSKGVNIAAAVSTGSGNITIVGQRLKGGSGTTVGIGANLTSTTGNITLQAISGNVVQTAGAMSGANITIDNTGAGLTSLMADSTIPASPLVVGTSMGGSIGSAGNITAGTGVSVWLDAISIKAGSLTTPGNINILGNTATSTYVGVNVVSGATVSTTGASSNINIAANYNVTHGGAISDTGTTLATISLRSTLGSVSGAGTIAENGAGLTIDTATTGILSGAISGSGAITKTGAGTTIFSANNSYTGTTTVSTGTLQIGNGSNTGTLSTGAVSVAANANLDFYRNDASFTIANAISGAGTVNFRGTGVSSQSSYYLTGNNSGLSGNVNVSSSRIAIVAANQIGTGAVTINSGAGLYANGGFTINNALSLAGNGWTENTYGQLGALRLQNGTNYAGTITLAADARIGAYGSTATVSGVISGAKNLDFNSGAGTVTLTSNNTYTGTTTISGGTVQVGNAGTTGTLGAGDVTLSNSATLKYVRSAATTIANNISGTGNVAATITGSTSDLTVDHTINLTGGTVNLLTDGNLLLSNAISTTNATSSAILLNAGKATAAGTSTGGDVQISGAGALTVGAGGRATVMTGSLAGSTGLGIVAGNSRFGSDEAATNYTTALGAGTYAIYREAPILSATVNSFSKIYDGNTFSGGNGFTFSGFVNGDSDAQLGAITYGGTSQNVKDAGTYSLTATAVSGVGYSLAYTDGTLTVGKADLVLSGTRVYDATKTFAGTYLTATGVNSETFAVTGSGDATNLISKNVQTNQTLNSVTGLAVGASNGANAGLSSNYNALTTAGSSVSVTVKAATLTATASNLTYNGFTQNQATSSSGFVTGDTITVSGQASAKDVGTYTSLLSFGGADAGNYSVTVTNADLVIGKADLILSGTRVYDAGKTFAGQYLTAIGVNGETFAVTGSGDATNLASKNVQSNQALNSLTGLALGSSGNGGSSSNYNDISTANSSVSVTAKTATVTGTLTSLTYNGGIQSQTAETTSGFIAGDDITISGQASGKNVATYTSALSVSGTDATNYNIAVTDADLVIGKANLTLSGTRVYDGSTSFAGSNLTATGVAGETFAVTGSGDTTNLNSKNVQTNQLLSTLTGLSLGTSANGGLSGNYNALSTTGSSVSITPKALSGSLISVAQKTYDGTDVAALVNGNFSLTGWISGEGATVNQTVGTYASKNVSANGGFAGSGSLGNVTATLSATQLTGTSGTDISNYTVPNTVSGAIGKITPASLNIKVNDTKMFVTQDANNAKDMGFTFTGLVGNDTAGNVLTATPVRTYTVSNNTFPLAGDYAGVYGLVSTPIAANDNYSISVTAGDLKVAAADKLLITVASQADTYGNRTASTAAVAGTGTVTAQYCLDQNDCTGVNLVDLTMTSNGGINWTATDRSGGTITLNTVIPTTGNLSSGNYLKVGNYTYGVGSIASSTQFRGSEVTGGTLTINRLSITPTAGAISRAYDGTNLVSGMTLTASQVKAGDIVTASTAGGTFTDKNVQANTSVTYTGLSLTGTDSANYSFAVSSVTGTGSITPKTVSLSATKVYDSGTDMTGKVTINTGIAGETLNYTGATLNDEDVLDASYISAITLTNGTNGIATNYQTASLTQATAGLNTASVTRLAASVTGTATNFTYNGAMQSQTAQTSSGFITGDDISFSGVASGKNVGTYTSNLVAGGTDASNYNITVNNANLVIGTATLTVTGANNSSTYSGVAQTNSGATITGTQGSDNFAISGYGSGTNASTTAYADNLSLTAADSSTLLANYTINYINGGLTIGKANLSATGSMVYDATTNFAGSSFTSIAGVNGEAFTATGSGALATANVQANQQLSSVSGLTLNGVSGALTSNYNALTTAQTSISVTPRTLTVTGANNTVTYNAYAQTNSGASYTGNQGSDSFTISGYGSGTNAGFYTDNLSVAGSGLTQLNNYSINYINRGLTIDKANLIATGNSNTLTYNGGNQSVAGFTVSGLLGSDTAASLSAISASGATGKNVGSYTNTVTAGTETNYIVSTVNGALTIGKANLILSGSRIYDAGTTFAGQYLTATGVAGETFAVTGLGNASNLTSKNVQTGSLSSVAGLGLGASSNGGLTTNYNVLSTAGSSVSVTPKALTMSITATDKVYDGGVSATVLKSSADVIGSDSVTFSNTSASFSDKNVARDANANVIGKTVTATGLAIGGTDATNYTLQNTTAIAIAKITPKGLTVSGITASPKTYDGNATATVSVLAASFAGLEGSDDVTVAATGTFNDKNAANNKTVTLVSTHGGADVGNYTITDQATTLANITPKALGGSLIGTAEKVYDGLVNATLGTSNFSLTGWIGTEGTGASVTQTAGTYADKNVSANAGTGAVSASLVASQVTVANGTLISNYTVPTTVTGNIGKITPATLGIKVNNTAMFVTQDATTAVDNGFTYTGLVNGESAATALGAALGASDRAYIPTDTHPQVGTYTEVYGLAGTPAAAYGNYNITVTKGDLKVVAADKLLVNIQSGSDIYGNRNGSTAMKAGIVTAQYCLSLSDCNTTNFVSLSMATTDSIHWTATDNTNNQISLITTISGGSFSTGGYLNFGNYGYGASDIVSTNVNQFAGTTVNGGVLNISKLSITPTAADVSRTYNASTLVDGMALNTLQMMTGDSLTASTTGGSFVNASKDVQTLTSVAYNNITLGGADRNNYALSLDSNGGITGLGSITPKTVSLSATKVYDGNTDMAGKVVVDTGVVGEALNYSSATANDKNVNGARYISAITLTDGSGLASNYAAPTSAGTNNVATVTQATLSTSLQGTVQKTYDGNTNATLSANNFNVQGWASGEGATVTQANGIYSSKNVLDNAGLGAVSATISANHWSAQSGTDLSNYVLPLNAMGNVGLIDKKAVTLSSINANGKTYDGSNAAVITSGTVVGSVGSETLLVSGAGTFDTKNAGLAKTVTASVASLSKTNGTGDWANYNLTTTGNITTTADIDKKALTLSSISAADKKYDGTTSAVVTLGSLVGLVDNEQLLMTASSAFVDASVGTNKTVLVNVLLADGLSGDLASNYALSFENPFASIGKDNAPLINPVSPQPSISPSQSGGSSSRIANQQTSAEIVKPEVVAKQCSVENPEACGCQNTLLEGVSLCMAPSNEAAADKAKDSAGLKLSKQ